MTNRKPPLLSWRGRLLDGIRYGEKKAIEVTSIIIGGGSLPLQVLGVDDIISPLMQGMRQPGVDVLIQE